MIYDCGEAEDYSGRTGGIYFLRPERKEKAMEKKKKSLLHMSSVYIPCVS